MRPLLPPFISLPRLAGPQPRTACGAHVPLSARLGWRGPSPATACGRARPFISDPRDRVAYCTGEELPGKARPRRAVAAPAGGGLRRVGDAVEASGLVVGHEEGTVGHHEHVGWATGRDAALQPARGERLVGRGAPVVDLHEGDPVPDRRRAVPRAVLGDEDPAAVLLGKHPPGVEAHADGRDVRAELAGRRAELAARAPGVVLRIADAVAVAERK